MDVLFLIHNLSREYFGAFHILHNHLLLYFSVLGNELQFFLLGDLDRFFVDRLKLGVSLLELAIFEICGFWFYWRSISLSRIA